MCNNDAISPVPYEHVQKRLTASLSQANSFIRIIRVDISIEMAIETKVKQTNAQSLLSFQLPGVIVS
jgi:hypothetical protein